MRRLSPLLPLLPLGLTLASCVGRPAAPPPPAPRPAPPPPPVALPAPTPPADWRDVPLTPGRWTWLGGAGRPSLSQYGEPGAAAVFAVRCEAAPRQILFSAAGALPPGAAGTMRFTTSFGSFAYAAQDGGGTPASIVARTDARDPNLDKLAFSRGRFVVDLPGGRQFVIPAWPEVARVIEDCR